MNGILRLWVAGFLVLAPAAAQADYAAGRKAHDAGDYAAAMREWRPLAEAGDADSQRGMGHIYSFGRGVTVGNEEAVKWHALAARQGDMYAQHALGVMFDFRLGVPRDGLNRLRAEANAKTKRVMAAAERRADDWRPKLETRPAERPAVPELCLSGR